MPVNSSNQQHPVVAAMVAQLGETQREHFEERAGILEHDAGLNQSVAEALALLEVVRVYGWPPSQK